MVLLGWYKLFKLILSSEKHIDGTLNRQQSVRAQPGERLVVFTDENKCSSADHTQWAGAREHLFSIIVCTEIMEIWLVLLLNLQFWKNKRRKGTTTTQCITNVLNLKGQYIFQPSPSGTAFCVLSNEQSIGQNVAFDNTSFPSHIGLYARHCKIVTLYTVLNCS